LVAGIFRIFADGKESRRGCSACQGWAAVDIEIASAGVIKRRLTVARIKKVREEKG
jgi:hypothetical protein